MAHPDDGLIRTFLDGELDKGETEAFLSHSDSCPECQAEIRVQEEAMARASRALLLLDAEPLVAEALGRARGRRGAPGRTQAGGDVTAITQDRSSGSKPFEPKKSSRRGAPGSLLKAASIALLITAGASSALPGSPVRAWLAQGLDVLTGDGGPEGAVQDALQPEEGDPTGLPDPSPPETWARMVPGGGGVEIGLFDLPDNVEIRVIWIQGEEVSVFAQEGTRFRTEANRLEAHSPPGGVRVEIPNALSRVLLTLDGRTLLRKSGPEVEILDAVQSRSPREVVFGSGASPNEE